MGLCNKNVLDKGGKVAERSWHGETVYGTAGIFNNGTDTLMYNGSAGLTYGYMGRDHGSGEGICFV